jgi:DNA-binding transcriptional regulator YdaS (Cro superfamily)
MRLIDLARSIGVDKATVTRWAQRRVPAERVQDVEAATGISRHELRPDIYGPAPETQGAA